MRESFLLVLVAGALLADTREEPVGLIMSPGGAKLLRSGTETPLDARAGDLLFSGDGVRTTAGPASFLYCPAKSIETLSPAGEVRLEVKEPKIRSGKITEQKPVASCFLPPSVRLAVASQQHYGVSMTRGVDTPEMPPVPPAKFPADVVALLAPIDQALAADPKDASALTARATVFETHNLPSNALVEYQKLRTILPDAIWVQAKIFELQQVVAAAQQASSANSSSGGNTYAVLIGVSKYKSPELALQFAERDASVFDQLLLSPRGGAIPADNILLLTNEKATTAAVRNAFQNFLKRKAGKADTVILMIAGHGTVEMPGSKKGFILTYDSDPQDLNTTALPMAELQSLFEEQVSKVGRVILYVDVCKSGTIGSIKNTSINGDVQHLGEVEGDLFGLMASRPRELSLEGPQFGGGHGLFSYYVLKGLEGDADANKDGKVDVSELIKYVTDQVSAASDNKQHPREFGTYDNSMKLSDGTKPGIEITQFPILFDSRSGEPLRLASQSPQSAGTPQAERAISDFESAIQAGRLLADDPSNAFAALDRLKPILTRERYVERQNELRVALEDRAQEVLLRYLIGDQVPQTADDFSAGAKYMEAALRLTPESLFLAGHEDFFQGRALLFQKKFAEAATLLESAVRIDPTAGYAYNALGIAYLEQAMFEKAIPAFRDAARRAQHWSYPLHNLALAYMETGNYQGAIAAYQQAIRLSPQFSYLPYNLGFVLQRIGRKKEAEVAYRKALAIAPNSPEPYNSIGVLEASEGRFTDAERDYRAALQRDPKFLAARHNLAVLLATRPERSREAIALWRENLAQDPEYVSSRLALARSLEAAGQTQPAIEQYQRILQNKPDYAAARMALANLFAKDGQTTEAIEQLQEVLKRGPGNLELFERLGDLQKSLGRAEEARLSYESALKFATDSAARSRLKKKIGR